MKLIIVTLIALTLMAVPFFQGGQLKAQTDTTIVQDDGNPLPTDFDIKAWLAGVGAFVAAILGLTALIKKWLKANGTLTKVCAGVISFGLAGIGYWLKLGIFDGVEWYYIFIYGLSAMLMAMGLSTWNVIKSLLELLKLKTPKY